MATHNFKSLKSKYDNFEHPLIVLTINGKDFAKNNCGFIVSDIEVELTSGFEASIATFAIYNTFDVDNSCFRINDAKPYIMLGSGVEIALGYEKNAQTVFCGFISRVNFVYEEGEMPGIRITAMDVKGVMMANNYSRQLAATNYGDAVKEILNNQFSLNIYSTFMNFEDDTDLISRLNTTQEGIELFWYTKSSMTQKKCLYQTKKDILSFSSPFISNSFIKSVLNKEVPKNILPDFHQKIIEQYNKNKPI